MSSKYWIDPDYVAHECCWDSAVVTRCDKGEGRYGSDIRLVCECNDDMAQIIAKALNAFENEKVVG